MAEDFAADVDLGFAEEAAAWKLKSRLFPSKIGGKPAWLDFNNIPKFESLTCSECSEPMVFLLQIYAPVEEKDECFHRALFLFCCKNGSCYNNNDSVKKESGVPLKVFRCQLSQQNDFYSPEPPDETQDDPDWDQHVAKFAKLCDVCGCFGGKKCGNCQQENYCCKSHQRIAWKHGHKQRCSSQHQGPGNPPGAVADNPLLFPEYEIVMETEMYNPNPNQEYKLSDQQKLEEYRQIADKLRSEGGDDGEPCEVELDNAAYKGTDDDLVFLDFKQRVSEYPDQVIRYERGGQPLWISTGDRLTKPPDCQSCNSPRQFEFQVMPQLLNKLKVDIDANSSSVDWGVIAVYTCVNNCHVSGGDSMSYRSEFIWKQDVA